VGLVALSLVLLSLRLFAFIHRHAVNLLFQDQWDFWTGMFQGRPLWDLFFWQHGPHREGLGYLVIRATAMLSGWDTRVESFVIGGVFVVSAGIALALKRRLVGRWSGFDVAIPLIVLTLGAWETLVGTTNPAHGSLSLLLLLLTLMAQTLERPALRVGLTVIGSFLAVFTGFTVLLGPLVSALLLLWTVDAFLRRQDRALHVAGLLASLATLGLFFTYRYHFTPAADCFVFPDPHPANYLRYIGVVLLRPFQLPRTVLGGVLGVALLVVAVLLLVGSVLATVRTMGRDAGPRTVMLLVGFAFLFAMNSAVGRVCLGVEQGASSRYVPYMLCLPLAMYLAAWSIPGTTTRRALLGALLALCVIKEVRSRANESAAGAQARAKRAWQACYLRLGEVRACDRESGFSIYPAPEVTHLEEKLRFLRERKLNLFKP
jgi:hypothetical protein